MIAFAAAVKAFPVMAVGYLVYRRMWKATAALVVALTLMVIVLPMPFRGIAGAYEDVATWTQGMVFRYDSGSIAQRPERGFGFKNQSLMALANRLLRDIPADAEARDGWKVNVASLPFGVVNKIILGLGRAPGRPLRRPDALEAPRPGAAGGDRGGALAPADPDVLAPVVQLLLRLVAVPLDGGAAPGAGGAPGSAGRRVLIGSVAGSLGSLGLSIVSARSAAGYGNSLVAAAILFAALGWRLAVEPGLGSPIQVVGGWLRRGLARSTTLPSGRLTPFPLPAPHLKGLAPGRPEAAPVEEDDRPG